ncbi:hypothetical protein ACCO45_003899 [Purpureocillium lilacinum]|uniref:Uncharacterized protein n=1 Tax=Purpureocillium lilacinum TaxID=33203 RepID=A0ACC4E1L2_PURLI
MDRAWAMTSLTDRLANQKAGNAAPAVRSFGGRNGRFATDKEDHAIQWATLNPRGHEGSRLTGPDVAGGDRLRHTWTMDRTSRGSRTTSVAGDRCRQTECWTLVGAG